MFVFFTQKRGLGLAKLEKEWHNKRRRHPHGLCAAKLRSRESFP